LLEPLATIVTNIPKDTPIHRIFNLLITSAASLVKFLPCRNYITKQGFDILQNPIRHFNSANPAEISQWCPFMDAANGQHFI